MPEERIIVLDFVARGDQGDWKIVLVESGPWVVPFDDHLRRLQDRLYDAVDAALDGHLAEKFPESKGKMITIQVDAYDLPQADVRDFFERFAEGVALVPDYGRIKTGNDFVKGVTFKLSFDSLEAHSR